jgi:hypothetical protein
MNRLWLILRAYRTIESTFFTFSPFSLFHYYKRSLSSNSKRLNGRYDDHQAQVLNHAALRRFFPLACGDGVVHTWDVIHGVDVENLASIRRV